MSYFELWNVMSQWKEEFTAREFASTFASPDPAKVLHDMCRKGLLVRSGWGKYKVTPQREYVVKKSNVSEAYEIVRSPRLPYAFTGGDAVLTWTRGGYNVDRFFGFYPISLRVRRNDLGKWERFFRSKGRRFAVEGKGPTETLFGVFYLLRPVERLRAVDVEGYRVDPLEDVVRFCQANVYTYEPALELLDEMYGLGLGARYREMPLSVK